jgi:hypothetical protein
MWEMRTPAKLAPGIHKRGFVYPAGNRQSDVPVLERLSQTPLAVCRPWTAVRGRVDGESTPVSQSARMDSLQTATDIEREQRARACSWEQVVAAIRNYARTQPPLVAADLQDWANLLEGIHQLNEPQRR